MQKAQINTSLVQWLNNKTKLSNHQIVLLDGFIFMLRKIKKQSKVRIYKDMFHQRFWSSLDRTLSYQLKSNKKLIPALYTFYFDISLAENLVVIENNFARITEKGTLFLTKSYQEQLDFIFSHIW